MILMEETIVPLLTYVDGSFKLCNETLEWLCALDKPFGVISCAGKFRTGKSFLLNRILDCEPSKGFGVGETVQACTKGLWISKKLLNVNDDLDMIVMDTEGIDALDASSEHDTKIFTFAVLLSSIFLYNSTGHIDETAVQTLSFMSNVSEYIDNDAIPPKFFWILRDFSLQMVDKNGKTLNNDEYLEYSLNECSVNKTNTRDCIKKLFSDRKLYTLPRASKTDSAQNLNKKHNNLNPKFMSAMAKLRDLLLDESYPITADGIPMSGSMFVKMCKILVEKVESSEMPVMKDAWSMLRDIQHNDIYKRIIYNVEIETEKWSKDTYKNLLERYQECRARCIKEFQNSAMKPYESSIYDEFNKRIDSLLLKQIDHKKIDIDEVVKESLKSIEMSSTESINREFESFLNENGESNACKIWFPSFITKLRIYMTETQETYIEKGKKEANASRQYEFQELTSKFEDAIQSLEYEKEKVLTLQSEIFSREPEETTLTTVSTGVNTDEIVMEETPYDESNKEHETIKLEYDLMCNKNDLLVESVNSYKNQLATLKIKVEEEIKDIKNEYSNKMKNIDDLLCLEKSENEKLKQQILISDLTNKKQLEDLCKQEEKNNSLHGKFMEFHKETLNEIRKKDSEYRESYSALNQELININRKVQEEKRVAVISQTESLHLKRQLEDYDSIQQDFKRLKRNHDEAIITKNRNEMEISSFKTRLQELVKECDTLRKINMQLENKVAVLETTSLLTNCKNNI